MEDLRKNLINALDEYDASNQEKLTELISEFRFSDYTSAEKLESYVRSNPKYGNKFFDLNRHNILFSICW